MSSISQKEDRFDEVFDSQKIFRVLMDSMSRPGKISRLAAHSFAAAPEGFNPYVLSVLKTLCDNNVSIAVGDEGNREWHRYLEINTNAVAEQVKEADYVVFRGDTYTDSFAQLNPGTLEFPQDSATAVISVTGLSGAEEAAEQAPDCVLIMAGPGIKDKITVRVRGLDRQYIAAFAEHRVIFPLGVDVILADTAGNVACIPRTTSVEVV